MTDVSSSSNGIQRQKTALKRASLSRPVTMAISDRLITKETTVFDYGCGHGTDVEILKINGFKAAGWDPSFCPENSKIASDVVNIGYVINVIEDQIERQAALRDAYSLAKKVLLVSARVDSSLNSDEEFGDGHLTSAGAFQKIFMQSDLVDYVDAVLCRRPVIAGFGICYVFRRPQDEAAYLGERAFRRRLEYRFDLIDSFGKDKVAKRFVKKAHSLGRLPLPEEFAAAGDLFSRFGGEERVRRLAYAHIERDKFEGTQEERKGDVMTFLSMLRLRGIKAPPLRELTPGVRADIKAFWPNYGEAKDDALGFLFQMGSEDAVRTAIDGATIGKRLPDSFYVHASAEDELPPLLRIIIFAGLSVVGELDYDIVKIDRDGRALSFLLYESFDDLGHPPLRFSVRVHLPKSHYRIRSYVERENPPILHRKETLVTPDYFFYERFKALTEEEDRLGLLSSPTIGTRLAWETLLGSKGLHVKAHKLVKIATPTN
jgi:DNA phosphorothioation-associated putative methyltransferase